MGTRIVTAETRQWGRLLAQANDDGYARATADIVAWLREHTASNMAQVFADAIERGEFRKVTA